VPIVAEADLRALLERHVELFNEAVASGDYSAFLANFADDAVMRFDDVPLGPFVGRAEIAQAYATQPASDTMALIDMEEVGGDGVKASFEWDAGGTGQMFLRWESGQVVELSIAFSA
jgi:steroid delta-isomerase